MSLENLTILVNCTDFTTSTQDMIDAIINQNLGDYHSLLPLRDQCPDICKVAWGTGNPDLAGIGVSRRAEFYVPLKL